MKFEAKFKSSKKCNRKLHIALHERSGPDHKYWKDKRMKSLAVWVFFLKYQRINKALIFRR